MAQGTYSSHRHISQEGLDLIKSFEGLSLDAYRDPGDVWTIGYGHTWGVHPGDHCTKAQAEAFLRADLREAEKAVLAQVQIPLNDHQFAALVSFTYNLGSYALSQSPLLAHLNEGRILDLQGDFLQHVHMHGKVMPGLVQRRHQEILFFYMEGV